MRNLSRLEKRTCLSSTCYRPSMVSNAFPDQSFSPCHHREIICSYIRTPTAPAVPRRYSFYVECPSLPSTVGFSRTPFFDCRPRRRPQIMVEMSMAVRIRHLRRTARDSSRVWAHLGCLHRAYACVVAIERCTSYKWNTKIVLLMVYIRFI